jgi:hypothetical protein
MKGITVALVFGILFITVAFASHGFDVSSLTSEDAVKCLKSKGYSFGVVRVLVWKILNLVLAK